MLPTILSAWNLSDAHAERVEVGNINQTYRIEHEGETWALQRLNTDIFSVEVHLDVDAVTRHLEARGLETPRLVPTATGQLWARDAGGGVWRLMTWIPGDNFSHTPNADICTEAGRLLGRFHAALADLQHDFRCRRVGVHDTLAHLATLRRAIETHPDHVAFDEAGPLGASIIAATESLALDRELPARIVHGDPKLNNIIFSSAGHARCFIDLDTVAAMTFPIELGDAFRSWCNPGGEDATDVTFDLAYFEAGLSGYAETASATLTGPEWDAIVDTVEQITLELAARFCADILNESYFGWDDTRFDAPWQHHLLRARGQWALARSIAEVRDDMRACVARVRTS